MDRRLWRVVGDPLVRPTGSGALSGHTVAVKDVFAVSGQRIGFGNPHWLADAPEMKAHAWAVERLLAAGASVKGIAQCDEFAYSLGGSNHHYGTPPNPRAPHRLPGGSSSGSASAVSMGLVSIGLGTDTGGSIRVPAAYQGLWGIRTTHGAVSMEGVQPLAPSADAVGWMTRDLPTLQAVGDALLPADSAEVGEVVTVGGMLATAESQVRNAVGSLLREAPRITWPMERIDVMLSAFRLVQAYQIWQRYGPWLAPRMRRRDLDLMGPGVRARMEWAANITDRAVQAAEVELTQFRQEVVELLRYRTLVIPTATSVAPPVKRSADLDAARRTTMRLASIAGVAGLPAVTIPLVTESGLPAGACLVGPAGSDRALMQFAGCL
jgi:amidase